MIQSNIIKALGSGTAIAMAYTQHQEAEAKKQLQGGLMSAKTELAQSKLKTEKLKQKSLRQTVKAKKYALAQRQARDSLRLEQQRKSTKKQIVGGKVNATEND